MEGAPFEYPEYLRFNVAMCCQVASFRRSHVSEYRDPLTKWCKSARLSKAGNGVSEMIPCVVIKSACDYADSHKNKVW